MLQKLIAVWIVAITFFVTDFASAQKTARIHVNPDQSRTVFYEESGYTYYPARASTYYFGQAYRGYTQRRHSSHWVEGYLRPYTKTWTENFAAPRTPSTPRVGRIVPPDGVERSTLVIPILGKVSEVSYEDWLAGRTDPLI